MREAIIRMANKAQLCQSIWVDEEGSEEIASLIRFFELAAAETRMKMVFAAPNHWVKEAITAEREACAKVADGFVGADPIAAAIRARGEA